MLFGSSGIRGVVNEEITPELALKVGKACASLYKNVVIGNDPRTSSEMVKNGLIAGLLSAGTKVTDISFSPTPTLAYAAKNFDMGVMVTASHNPSQYNGIKFFNPDGSGISHHQAEEIEQRIKEEKWEKVRWNQIEEVRKYRGAINDHIKAILNEVETIEKKMMVAVDCANGSTSVATPYLLQKMVCRVIVMNAQPDGFFPSHEPEPIEKNLGDIIKLVKHSPINIAFAHDCDGDRVVAIDKDGNLIPNDKLLAFLAKHINKKGKIVVPVNASLLIKDYLPHANIIYTRVGDVFISQKLREINGDFGGEPSGTWIFPSFSYCPDAIYAAAKIVKIAEEMNIEEEIESIPHYHTMRASITSTKEKISGGMKKIEEEVKKFDYEKASKIDGIRLDMHDSWVLVRASGTEPKVRITVEAKEKKEAESLYNKVVGIAKRCVK